MREYTLRETSPDQWEIRTAEVVDVISSTEDPVLYAGPLLGATELLAYLEDRSTPVWAQQVASWEDQEIDAFLRRLAVRPPARKIDRLKRVVTLISEGEFPRPEGVA